MTRRCAKPLTGNAYCTRSVSLLGGDTTPVALPMIEISLVATGVLAATLTLIEVATAPAATVVDPKVRLTPAGTPDAVSATAPPNPPPRVMLTPTLPVPPGGTVTLAGVSVTAMVPWGSGGIGSGPAVPLPSLHAGAPSRIAVASQRRAVAGTVPRREALQSGSTEGIGAFGEG